MRDVHSENEIMISIHFNGHKTFDSVLKSLPNFHGRLCEHCGCCIVTLIPLLRSERIPCLFVGDIEQQEGLGPRGNICHIVEYWKCPSLDRLPHWGWGKMADILQTTLSRASSSMKVDLFWLKFHWSLFLMVQLKSTSISTDNGFMVSRYKRQTIIWTNGDLILVTHICVTRQWRVTAIKWSQTSTASEHREAKSHTEDTGVKWTT